MYPVEMAQRRSVNRVQQKGVGSTVMARPSFNIDEAEPGFLNDFMNNTSPILKLWVVLMASYLAFILFMP